MTHTIATSLPPVTLDEVKAYLRIDGNDDDSVLLALIDAATEWVEEQTRQTLQLSESTQTIDGFPTNGVIVLPAMPLRSVNYVWYFNETGDQQLVPSNSYTVDITTKPGRIVLKPSRTWPTTDGSAASVWIEYTAGYSTAASVPATLRQAIKFMVGHWFEHREAATDRRIDKVPLAVESILQQHTFIEVA